MAKREPKTRPLRPTQGSRVSTVTAGQRPSEGGGPAATFLCPPTSQRSPQRLTRSVASEKRVSDCTKCVSSVFRPSSASSSDQSSTPSCRPGPPPPSPPYAGDVGISVFCDPPDARDGPLPTSRLPFRRAKSAPAQASWTRTPVVVRPRLRPDPAVFDS